MKFKPYYFYWFIVLFLVEVFIAIYVRDDFIRPYVGDVLVVGLIYAFVRAFFKIAILNAAMGTLAFAYLVEILQYFKIVEVLGLESSVLARTVIGTTFSWKDLVAYSVGVVLLLGFEWFAGRHQQEWRSLKLPK